MMNIRPGEAPYHLDCKTLAVRHGRLASARMAVAPISVSVCEVIYSILNKKEYENG